MKIIFMTLITLLLSACASHDKCVNEKEWTDSEIKQRQHFFEPAGTWRR
jgi:hypothetical protein